MPSDNPEDLQRAEGLVLDGDDAVITRAGDLVPGSFNAESNTVDVCFSTGARGLRYDWASEQYYEEELEITRAAVDLTRVEAGVCQVLNSHGSYDLSDILGIAQRAWIEGDKAMATLKLSAREDLAGIVRDIKDGIIRAVSVGYRVGTWQRVMPEQRKDGGARILMIAKRWTPHEISFVPVPFDLGASSRALAAPAEQGAQPLDAATAAQLARNAVEPARRPAQSQAITRALQQPAVAAPSPAPAAPAASTQEETPMPEQARNEGGATPVAQPTQAEVLAAERTRTAGITELCARHALPDLAAGLIRDGVSTEAAGLKVLEALAVRDAAAGGHRNVRVETTGDEHETQLRGMEEAIRHRVDSAAPLTDNGRRFRNMGLLQMGSVMLERAGVRTAHLSRMDLAGQILMHRSPGMMGTSDFGNLLANVANKRLRMGYEENPGTYQRWARRAPNAPDFKTMTVVQLAAMPDLVKVNEAGEFKYGALSDGAETYAVATYGRVVAFTRQSMVNDDLRGFDRLVTGFGASASRLENRTVYAQLTANAALSDGGNLFNATAQTTAGGHANLASGGGSALQFSALTTARAAMRVQKGLQNEELNLAPSYLIVPAALEQTAYQLTSSNYTPATQANVNEFRTGGRTALDPVVEPILDAASATAWYLAAQNSQVDTVEYCYLDGAEGPVIDSYVEFSVDGMSLKCRLDFAAKALEYRGLYKAVGV